MGFRGGGVKLTPPIPVSWFSSTSAGIGLSRTKCKNTILLYLFLHTACVLKTFLLFNRLVPGTSFYRKNYRISFTLHSRVYFSINFLKEEIVTDMPRDHTVLYSDVLRIFCKHLHELYTLNSFSDLKGLK